MLAVLVGEDGKHAVADLIGPGRTSGAWLADGAASLPLPAVSQLNGAAAEVLRQEVRAQARRDRVRQAAARRHRRGRRRRRQPDDGQEDRRQRPAARSATRRRGGRATLHVLPAPAAARPRPPGRRDDTTPLPWSARSRGVSLYWRAAEAGNRYSGSERAADGTLAGQKESRRVAAVSSSPSPFGQNEWLVEEMYRKFREDPSSVDPELARVPRRLLPRADHRRRRLSNGNGTRRHAGRPPQAAPAASPPAKADRAEPSPQADPPRPSRQGRRPPRPSRPKAEPAKTDGQADPQAERRARRGRRGRRAARRRCRRRQEHERLAGRADRHQRAGHPGQADDRQPHRHQQPPQAHPRRQDLASPTCWATRSCRRSRSSRT